MSETYLGDGLYATYDGFAVCLRAPHVGGDDRVYLEPEVLLAFLKFWRSTDAGRNVAACPICGTNLETRDAPNQP